MTLQIFEDSLTDEAPPPGLIPVLEALWREARGDWHAAHELVQSVEDPDGAWVHAYLHRKEGDASNAAYWYRRAGRPVAHGAFRDEWRHIADTLLGAS